jgi:hypothetical protein
MDVLERIFMHWGRATATLTQREVMVDVEIGRGHPRSRGSGETVLVPSLGVVDAGDQVAQGDSGLHFHCDVRDCLQGCGKPQFDLVVAANMHAAVDLLEIS